MTAIANRKRKKVKVTLQSPPVDNEHVDEINKNVVEQTENETMESSESVKNTEDNNTENSKLQPQNTVKGEQQIDPPEKLNNSVEEQLALLEAEPEKQNEAEADKHTEAKPDKKSKTDVESEKQSSAKSEQQSEAKVESEKQIEAAVVQQIKVDVEQPKTEAEQQEAKPEAKNGAETENVNEAKTKDIKGKVKDNKKTDEWSSTYEKQNKKEENHKDMNNEDSPKKSRRSWVTSGSEEVRKRKISSGSMDTEKKEPQVFKKTTKKIKLVRRSYCEQSSIDESEPGVEAPSIPKRRKNWGSVDYRSSDVCKVDVESLKEVCPKLEFLEENEVKLEPAIRRGSHVSVENEKVARERRESADRKSESDKSVIEGENEEPVVDKNIIAMNRKISIVDDTASKLKPPPSPAKNPVSEVLYISNLVRPFTLKALKELLERTGKLKEENGLWTDKIKSKCIVEYETAEEAEATRNALHGIHWPIGNGKKLQIEYSTKEELDKAFNPPPIPVPVIPEKVEKENKEPTEPVDNTKHGKDKEKEEKRRRSGEHVREWDLGKEDRRGRSRSRERVRKYSKRSPSPSDDFIGRKNRKAEEAVPQKLMDDLFLKTKATPSIYWQPLSPEEIQMKQQQREIRMEEHKRRMEGTRPPMGGGSGGGGVRDRGGRGGPPYRRRYD
ncbi:unnamed protein product [Brassicogethes aeneus]|uniref:RRM domain-containing protein n=1 Tax=Brassicogethes aeneus TaxID=1431903 RepID=A0A9P0B712_BRAAE|nr:unnamed protein product [Brassicogethes aeneus]